MCELCKDMNPIPKPFQTEFDQLSSSQKNALSMDELYELEKKIIRITPASVYIKNLSGAGHSGSDWLVATKMDVASDRSGNFFTDYYSNREPSVPFGLPRNNNTDNRGEGMSERTLTRNAVPVVHTDKSPLSLRMSASVSALHQIENDIHEMFHLIDLDPEKKFTLYKEEYSLFLKIIDVVITALEYYCKNSPLNYSFMEFTLRGIAAITAMSEPKAYFAESKDCLFPVKVHEYFEEFDKTHTEDQSRNYACANDYLADYTRAKLGYYHISNAFQLILSVIDYCCLYRIPLRCCKVCGTYFIANGSNKQYCSTNCANAQKQKNKDEYKKQVPEEVRAAARTTKSFKKYDGSLKLEDLDIPSGTNPAIIKGLRNAFYENDYEQFRKYRRQLFIYQKERVQKGELTAEELDKWLYSLGRQPSDSHLP